VGDNFADLITNHQQHWTLFWNFQGLSSRRTLFSSITLLLLFIRHCVPFPEMHFVDTLFRILMLRTETALEMSVFLTTWRRWLPERTSMKLVAAKSADQLKCCSPVLATELLFYHK
jgi:hypothetical protein